MRRQADFWLRDLEPLGGRLRALFYVGIVAMLVTGTYRSPVFAARSVALTDPDFYTPMGVLSWIGVGWASPIVLQGLAAVGVLALICSALGLGRSVSPWLGAACMLVLYGVVQGAVGVTHRWHLPIYTLCVLCLARSSDGFSLDEWLADRYSRYPRQQGPALFHSGFARKLVLVFAVATLFGGFAAKWIESGLAWADGSTLRFDIARSSARWPWLADQIIGSAALAQALSVFSLLLEGLAPLALFSRRARHVMVLLASGFHVGIMLVMTPRYFPQMWCYLLLVDWGAARAWIRERRWQRLSAPLEASISQQAARRAQLAGAYLIVGLLVVVVARVEFWPLTHIPMYSVYRGPVGAYNVKHFSDEAQLRAWAVNCVYDGLCMGSRRWIRIELIAADGSADRLEDEARLDVQRGKVGAHPKQLWRVFRELAARIVVERSEDALDFVPGRPPTKAEVSLRALLPAVRRSVPDWERYERLIIVARVAGDKRLLTALELAPTSR